MRPRALLTAFTTTVTALAGAALLAGPAAAAPASPARAAAAAHGSGPTATLRGLTTVTTAPGIASTLLRAGVLPLPVPPTRFRIGFHHGLTVSYGFPITSGDPYLAGPSGDILHTGGIDFVSFRGRHFTHLEIGKFDIDLAAGKIYATQVDFAPARIPVLDLDLTGLKVTSRHGSTVLTGITLRLDPAAAGALNNTFGLSLPVDGSLVFGTATVTLRG